ncbi:MAG: DNA-3-methyladenine glycosylase I [Gemmatimonadetes bacterium]|nr:DNA-3-methyladenine glycosylase I [Gemmatimonadota bacterium]
MSKAVRRCDWVGEHPLSVAYHDTEWGVPEHGDQKLFEHLILDGAQAGLSWFTILSKRAAYRAAFEGFDPERIARFEAGRVVELLRNPGIVRNRQKIESTVTNARALLRLQDELGSFAHFLWHFVGGRPRRNAWRALAELPARTPESEAMSRALLQRGFRFVGPTICYAFMQATGMVNDHLVDCFRYHEVGQGITG